MICAVCGSDNWRFVRRYLHTDKYEQWVGIKEPLCRAWWKCRQCGLMRSTHSYDINILDNIYTNGYRAVGFRGDNIEASFRKIVSLPPDKSENEHRVRWFLRFPTGDLLDVGAGLGVFLYGLGNRWSKSAIEPNVHSSEFIRDKLNIPCKQSFYRPRLFDKKFDCISCIHVLEHQKNPEDMLLDFKKDLYPGGRIFLEVPDSVEFDYLPQDHDEFNSTHLYFFNLNSLSTLVENCGYKVTDIHRTRTKARDLSRIMMMAECVS